MISLPISRREIHRYKGPSTYITNFLRVLYEVTVGFLWSSRDKSKLVDSILRYCLPGLVRERESARGTVNAGKKLVRSRYPNPSSSHRNSSWVFVSGRFRFLKLLFLVCLLTTVPNSEPNCGRWWRGELCKLSWDLRGLVLLNQPMLSNSSFSREPWDPVQALMVIIYYSPSSFNFW